VFSHLVGQLKSRAGVSSRRTMTGTRSSPDQDRGSGEDATASAPPAALVLQNVSAGYGRTQVLRDVTVVVPAHSVVAVLGANGVGKTTMMRVAAGFLRPTSGSVLLDGVDVTTASVHERARLGICDIPEGRGIFPSLSVRENLLLQSFHRQEAQVLALATEAFPILGKRLKQLAGSLSGGEQQMLALSRAYVTQPSLVLLDEVSLGLSPLLIDSVYMFLETLRSRGTSLVLIEQYVKRALEMADHVYVLDRGVVSIDMAAADVPSSEILDVYLGQSVKGGVAPGNSSTAKHP